MLFEFGAKNYFSFKEGFEISLRLGSSCPFEYSKGKEYTNVLCVKGANASGKTNALKAIVFLKEFCTNSFNNKPDDLIDCESFFSNNNPIEFFIVFQIEDIEYRYELELTKNSIISERLYKKEKRQVLLVSRENDAFKYTHPTYRYLRKIKLRKNASFISIGNQYDIASIKRIYYFFDAIIKNVNYQGKGSWTPGLNSTSRYYFAESKKINFLKSIIRKCDLGIDDISIEEKVNDEGVAIYIPTFHHKVGRKKFELGYWNQSSGTQSLYLQLAVYDIVLSIGGTLVLDEFDINLHPDILPLLTDLFENEEINTKNAQLIFSTHNSDIMDRIGKYKIILTSKEDNESYLYRLDEVKGDVLRNDRPISPIYKSGKIGGVPKV
ncbi:MAG: ATP-binding protein [Leptospiraceae bacterium]|nr:ATP-binding protein [Leptospiraceae bacterium]MCZ8347421.1 ATP-binding protein [Leptospiraceae bacterium]